MAGINSFQISRLTISPSSDRKKQKKQILGRRIYFVIASHRSFEINKLYNQLLFRAMLMPKEFKDYRIGEHKFN